jgi:hypothetical protein
MATFLDIGLVSHFQVVFTVLLVFTIVYAILEKSKMLGDNKGLHALIALSISMMMLFVPGVTQVVGIMAPWFILMFLAIIFFLILLLAFGTKMETITGWSSDWVTGHWVLLIIGIIIFLGAIGSVYGGSLLPYTNDQTSESINTSTMGSDTGTNTGDFNSNVGRVIFHPKTLGMILLLIIGSLAIKLMTGTPIISK